DLREIPMPEETGHLRQIDAALNPLLVEEAKLHAGGHFGKDGEVRAGSVVRRAQRIRISGPDLRFDTTRVRKSCACARPSPGASRHPLPLTRERALDRDPSPRGAADEGPPPLLAVDRVRAHVAAVV